MAIKLVSLIPNLLPNFLFPIKHKLIIRSLAKFGAKSKISVKSEFTNPENVEIGSNVFINSNFYCSNEKKMIIRDRVMFGANCSIIGGDHKFGDPRENMRFISSLGINKSIIIEEDAWIGHGTVILKNGSIGEGTIIGAGSVLTRKAEPYSIYAGNPAVFIRNRFEKFNELKDHLDFMKKEYSFSSKYSLTELEERYK